MLSLGSHDEKQRVLDPPFLDLDRCSPLNA